MMMMIMMMITMMITMMMMMISLFQEGNILSRTAYLQYGLHFLEETCFPNCDRILNGACCSFSTKFDQYM